MNNRKYNNILLYHRWPWHLLFWAGYSLFRFWMYYITVVYYPRIFLEYMLLAEILFAAVTYFTIWLYKRLFTRKKFLAYFLLGVSSWILYLCARTAFQFWYLSGERSFQKNTYGEIFITNITVLIVSFLFITACKYFKDGYIAQQFEAERKEQQLIAEVNNLKSQIAPHFLFNTLNNLYGLAVERSDKLPDLMLRLSDLLRHSLYETQKPLVRIKDEMAVLKSYIELERVRLEESLELEIEDAVPAGSAHLIAPLILIVFVENAFKHAKLVHDAPVHIYMKATLENDWFSLTIKNNYNKEKTDAPAGIGLTNVIRRLEVLYPGGQHQLTIAREEEVFSVLLQMKLTREN